MDVVAFFEYIHSTFAIHIQDEDDVMIGLEKNTHFATLIVR